MSDQGVPPHMRRARMQKRAQLFLALVAAAFVLYRLAAVFRR